MMPSDGGSLCDELDDDHDEVAESDDETDYQTHMDGANQRSHGQNSVEGHLACLDDETLFGVVKKLVCSSLRQLISSAARSVGGSKSNHGTGHFAATKAITRLNVSYFF
ncbi:hypothetical protein PAHAL_2G234500 [Panicum hallii]|uniref:Uncharacterized protein n=1 Tax=Panicum hallii TaxID=206008 RepID=A0A2T8KQ46_9POAL|nr:hypothetical protein PAHAL_2G234500 [Panicum hallii]